MTDHRPPGFNDFYDHVRKGELCFPRCDDCGRYHWYPMKRCPHCQSARIGWSQVKGPGQLFSWTVVRHAFEPALAAKLPYIVGLVEFADAPGVRYVTNIVDTRPEELDFDMPVSPVFPDAGDDAQVVRFRPLAASR